MKWHGISTRKRIAEVSLCPLRINGVHPFAECLERSRGGWCRAQGCIIGLLIDVVRNDRNTTGERPLPERKP